MITFCFWTEAKGRIFLFPRPPEICKRITWTYCLDPRTITNMNRLFFIQRRVLGCPYSEITRTLTWYIILTKYGTFIHGTSIKSPLQRGGTRTHLIPLVRPGLRRVTVLGCVHGGGALFTRRALARAAVRRTQQRWHLQVTPIIIIGQ